MDGIFDGISRPDIRSLFSDLEASTCYEQFSSLVRQAQGSAGLMQFWQLNLDVVLTLDPRARHQARHRLVRLITGNPVTMGEMIRHIADAGSYAPVTILIQELPDGRSRIAYDSVASAITLYDHYVEPGYLLGNIKDKPMLELITSPAQRKFGQDKHDTLTQFCRDVRFACNGGCPKDRFATSPYGEPGQHYLCPGYKEFFYHVRGPIETMAGLLRAGRAPAELMRAYVAQDARRGRNDPCTCGSGRKWKRCHGT